MAKAKMGLVQATALVFGNMVGSGVFLLPAALAAYGSYALGGWLLTSAGAIVLALVFASLGAHLPAAGGPYAYTRLAFGDLVGFLVAWGYWVALWSGNAAIAVAFVGALQADRAVDRRRAAGMRAAVAIGALWTLTAVNVFGVRSAGAVQVVTSVLKMLPLLAVALWGLLLFRSRRLAGADPRHQTAGRPGRHRGAHLVGVPRPRVGHRAGRQRRGSGQDHPARHRARHGGRRHSLHGGHDGNFRGGAAGQLVSATAPFALAAEHLWGAGAALLVAAGAAISAFGTLNGWILLQAQLPSGGGPRRPVSGLLRPASTAAARRSPAWSSAACCRR